METYSQNCEKIAAFADGKMDISDFDEYVFTELMESSRTPDTVGHALLSEMALCLSEGHRGHRTVEDVRLLAYRALYQKYFKTKILLREEIEALTTKRLLAYRNSLLKWYEKTTYDMHFDKNPSPDGKDSQLWNLVYNIVKEELSTREHVDG